MLTKLEIKSGYIANLLYYISYKEAGNGLRRYLDRVVDFNIYQKTPKRFFDSVMNDLVEWEVKYIIKC